MRCTEVAGRPFPDGKFTSRDIGDRGRSMTESTFYIFKRYMPRIRVGIRSLLLFIAGCAFLIPFAIAAIRAYKLASGSRLVLTRSVSDPIFDARYRVAILYDNVALKPIAFAIEKAPQEIERADLPTFCTREHWVRTDGRRATRVMDLKVNGEIVVPMDRVQVFIADWGKSPQRVMLPREEYLAIAGSNLVPKSDDQLWNSLHLMLSDHKN